MKDYPWKGSGRVLTATFGLLWLCVHALGAAEIPATPDDKPSAGSPVHFVASNGFDFGKILPPPPAPGSIGALGDLEVVLRVQASRTPADVAYAKRVDREDLDLLIPGYTKAAYPKTDLLISEVIGDLAPVATGFKDLYRRLRPPQVESSVHPCVPIPKSFSYPSGHSTRAFVTAGVLAAIDPDRKAEFYDRAHAIAWARVVSGVHFPTDDVGGRMVTEAFMAKLLQNPDFLAEAAAARAEFASAAVAQAAR